MFPVNINKMEFVKVISNILTASPTKYPLLFSSRIISKTLAYRGIPSVANFSTSSF